ncbi:DUF4936 family protein [Actimicrobium antarcticum]|uniref:DUF4936 domain-containing protein n=1 Tax=Actimicrobium antarcticum TaxID=1051899 RepID=A0ABP7SGW2_9BURK
MDIFVYYTIRSQDAALARQRAAALRQRMAAGYDIAVQLKRRPEEKEGLQTWMEIYQDVPPGFDTVIEHVAAEEGLAMLSQGYRHIEHFEDLAPCA